jgi:K(+)-stimulated pyrophosphate-energized sodium pump
MKSCHGDAHGCKEMGSCHGKMEACEPHMRGEHMIGKCDMRECAKMSKEECAKMCDSLKCTPEEKEMCMAHYDENGKFIGSGGHCEKKGACCGDKKECKDPSKCKDKKDCKGACKH